MQRVAVVVAAAAAVVVVVVVLYDLLLYLICNDLYNMSSICYVKKHIQGQVHYYAETLRIFNWISLQS